MRLEDFRPVGEKRDKVKAEFSYHAVICFGKLSMIILLVIYVFGGAAADG